MVTKDNGIGLIVKGMTWDSNTKAARMISRIKTNEVVSIFDTRKVINPSHVIQDTFQTSLARIVRMAAIPRK